MEDSDSIKIKSVKLDYWNIWDKNKHYIDYDYAYSREEVIGWMEKNCEKRLWRGHTILWVGAKYDAYVSMLSYHKNMIKSIEKKEVDEGYGVSRDEIFGLLLYIDNYDLLMCRKNKDKAGVACLNVLRWISEVLITYKRLELDTKLPGATSLWDHICWVLDSVFENNNSELINNIKGLLN